MWWSEAAIPHRGPTAKAWSVGAALPQYLGVRPQPCPQLLQRQPFEISPRRAGGSDHADLGTGRSIDGRDLDRAAIGRELEIDLCGGAVVGVGCHGVRVRRSARRKPGWGRTVRRRSWPWDRKRAAK